MFFLRKSRLEPLPVAMSGVRMGERALQIQTDAPAIAGAIAAKVGLSGQAAIAVSDDRRAAKAHRAASQSGVLVDVQVTALESLPFPDDAFDVIVVHAADGWFAALDEQARVTVLRGGHRVLRGGGRIVVIDAGTRHGLGAIIRTRRTTNAYEAAGGAAAALTSAGFRASRVLADREGYRFTEAVKR